MLDGLYAPNIDPGCQRAFVATAASQAASMAWAAAARSLAAFQFQGRSSSILLAGWSGSLARTEASQA
jgi:hypothetical protein